MFRRDTVSKPAERAVGAILPTQLSQIMAGLGSPFFAASLIASCRSLFTDIRRKFLHVVDRNAADQHEGVRCV